MKQNTPSTITKVGMEKVPSFEQGGETYYHVDRVIDAYKSGLSDGRRNYEKSFEDLFERNLRDAVKFLNGVALQLHEMGISLEKVYMQITKLRNISFLLIVPEEDFLKESFYQIYDKIYTLEQEYNVKSLQVDLSFTQASPYLNKEIILSDGFVELIKGK